MEGSRSEGEEVRVEEKRMDWGESDSCIQLFADQVRGFHWYKDQKIGIHLNPWLITYYRRHCSSKWKAIKESLFEWFEEVDGDEKDEDGEDNDVGVASLKIIELG